MQQNSVPFPTVAVPVENAWWPSELVRLGVISLAPDFEVHPMDVPWWVAEQERAEIRAELAGSELL